MNEFHNLEVRKMFISLNFKGILMERGLISQISALLPNQLNETKTKLKAVMEPAVIKESWKQVENYLMNLRLAPILKRVNLCLHIYLTLSPQLALMDPRQASISMILNQFNQLLLDIIMRIFSIRMVCWINMSIVVPRVIAWIY